MGFPHPILSCCCSWMLGLQTLSVRNTLVRGTIPQELADLPYLENVDVRDTRMTCCASLEVGEGLCEDM